MSKVIILSPHDDDSVLFAAFTCLREKPLVMICTDAYIQSNRGEIGCDAETRAKESEKAHKILGCEVLRLGIRDDKFNPEILWETLDQLDILNGPILVYAPALQGGNFQHDITNQIAHALWGNVIEYTTYTRTELWTKGSKEVKPILEELELKNQALACYVSQINLPATRPHFEAVKGKSEWYM